MKMNIYVNLVLAAFVMCIFGCAAKASIQKEIFGKTPLGE
ncbi:unnamed protein product, partial [marine sediment metagenome]